MNWTMIAVFVAIISLVNGGFVWAVKCLLAADRKKLAADLKRITDDNCEQDDRHDQLQKEFTQLKDSLPEKYIRREDWIICISRIEQKIDAIWKYVIETKNLGGR